MPFQPINRAYVTRTGITVEIVRSSNGDTMTVTVFRVARLDGGDGRLIRQGRHYTGTPVHEITTRYAPQNAGLPLTPAQIETLDIHHPRYIYEIRDRGILGILFPVLSNAPAINGRRNFVLVKWVRD